MNIRNELKTCHILKEKQIFHKTYTATGNVNIII
jgi:hypothetical protein